MPLRDVIQNVLSAQRERVGESAYRDLITMSLAIAETSASAHALRTGESAPDFALPDATGKKVSLGNLLKRGPVVLSFYRGGW